MSAPGSQHCSGSAELIKSSVPLPSRYWSAWALYFAVKVPKSPLAVIVNLLKMSLS